MAGRSLRSGVGRAAGTGAWGSGANWCVSSRAAGRPGSVAACCIARPALKSRTHCDRMAGTGACAPGGVHRHRLHRPSRGPHRARGQQAGARPRLGVVLTPAGGGRRMVRHAGVERQGLRPDRNATSTRHAGGGNSHASAAARRHNPGQPTFLPAAASDVEAAGPLPPVALLPAAPRTPSKSSRQIGQLVAVYWLRRAAAWSRWRARTLSWHACRSGGGAWWWLGEHAC